MTEFDWQTWTPRLAGFYEALLRSQSASRSVHLHDLPKALRYGLTADLGSFTLSAEELLRAPQLCLKLDADAASDKPDVELELADLEAAEAGGEEWDPAEHDDTFLEGPDPRAAATLRRIVRKQRGDPHNRETLLGFPLIGVGLGSNRIVGPLLLWEMDGVAYDPQLREIRLTRRNSTPDLNTILLGKLVDDPDDVTLANETLLPLLYDDDFGPDTVPELIRVVTGIYEPLASHEEIFAKDYSLKSFLRQASSLRDLDPALIAMMPVLTNGSRSYAFLLSDLRAIASQSSPAGDSVLAQVVGDVPKEGAPNFDPIHLPFQDTSDGGDPLWFPFPSNRAQREVAQTADRVDVLTVQGPPGTGKSQTIANLVCHLVTEGHSVLVTSHQRKAMEVLSRMLGGFGGLVALSMLSGDRTSLQQLRTQLEGVQDRPPDWLTEEFVERGQAALMENDRQLRRLTRRFMELRRLEHEMFPKFVRYQDIRGADQMSPLDDPVDESPRKTAKLLVEWASLFESLRAALPSFDAVFRPDGPQTTRVRETEIARTLSILITSADSLNTPVSPAGRRVAARLTARSDDKPLAVISRLETWIAAEGPVIERNLRDLGQRPEEANTLGDWLDALSSIRRDRLDDWQTNIRRLADFFARDSTLRGVEYDWDVLDANEHRIREHAKLLGERGTNLLWWFLSPEAYQSRSQLKQWGFRARRRRLSDIDDVLDWLNFYSDAERRFVELLDRLPLESVGQTQPRSKERILRAMSQASTAAQMLIQLDTIPQDDFASAFGDAGRSSQCATPAARASLLDALTEARRWIDRQSVTSDLLDSLRLQEPWRKHAGAVADGIREGALSAEGSRALEQLTKLSRNYNYYRRMLDLETVELSCLSNTLSQLRASIQRSEKRPDWLDEAEKAMEAHRLANLIRASLSADPDDIEEISEALRRGQEKRRRMISELIKRKKELAAYDALQTPAIRVPLLSLRKLLGRKRLNDSLLNLRDSIDYNAVLRVFPCWICTIDDAARLFPPKAGMFDYLIVDEASQCSQATALPLAFRARKMIVVGDRKQLQPVTSRFLSANAVRLIQEEYGIHCHPKAHFLDGKDSLLGLAEVCSNASRFLDEHFRCDPAIIRWSNQRFYDNRLQILTRRRPGRARVPLEVRQLMDADEDRDKKVNQEEAVAVVQEIRRLIETGEAAGKSIGAISPFRPQVELIQLLLARAFHRDPELLNQHEIIAMTADGFQGDERDIILYSFRQGPSSHAGSIATIQSYEERLNVAFTRARERAVCFVSLPIHEFPKGAIRSFLEHAKRVHDRGGEWDVDGEWPDRFDSEFEKAVCSRLRDRQLRVTTQVPCGRYLLDLVVEDSDGRQLAVECDGDWKMDDLGQLRPEDYQRQDIIERAGWPVHRVSGRRWLLDPTREIERILKAVRRQPARDTVRALRGPRDEIKIAEVKESLEPVSVPVGKSPGEVGFDAEDATAASSPEPLPDGILVRRLCRWVILRPQVEWTVYDQLEQLDRRIQGGHELVPSQREFLNQALDWARNLGFDPDVDP
ncbi:AAA domain-containing protein [Candidatus Palauibacter sp.]|uniref:AAA domain-containing protein n=1 Tax=Candidatus Palauibacter sp. TaxID=3101350 RepID=UPI003B028868